ncbi:DUF3558 domain-containing protein [Nocardia farcinica]|uniref:DUF3558 domain-containing protein n=1 Tax=Nocardia farcinica TaxID=37329 RepID=UPI001894CE2D|nr:DUF3558 domain-containing protein [Nocardia farcinica]MBF6263302.1 DUF3558 domain-containing protein [Nocardia farcinica]MBF6281915.1 DUF3558 domain-containing protein [Nocardia farcinica]MBF6306671.1 DUF3558 domain-containing protein [Nocardia farcinica]MBF6393252.1 DUF3558 domain-containing protein [Nocardia farcinica]MBF6490335.1 DUF3558 domain-containing protein [Nocardia farcinica]
MRTAAVLRAIIAAVGVVGVVGCGATVDGAATTAGDSSGNVTFNPCTDLPDDVLRSTGVDPSTKRVTTDAAGSSSWRICNWEAIDLPYYLSVASTSHTQEESRNNPKLTGFRDITIGPRQALIYQDKVDSRGNICYVSLPAAQGMFEVAASWRASQPITADRCELAVEHAKDLEPVLPK